MTSDIATPFVAGEQIGEAQLEAITWNDLFVRIDHGVQSSLYPGVRYSSGTTEDWINSYLSLVSAYRSEDPGRYEAHVNRVSERTGYSVAGRSIISGEEWATKVGRATKQLFFPAWGHVFTSMFKLGFNNWIAENSYPCPRSFTSSTGLTSRTTHGGSGFCHSSKTWTQFLDLSKDQISEADLLVPDDF